MNKESKSSMINPTEEVSKSIFYSLMKLIYKKKKIKVKNF